MKTPAMREALKPLHRLETTVRNAHAEAEPIPFLRFDEKAQDHFAQWRADREKRLRIGDMAAALVHRFRGSNHIRQPGRAYRTKYGRRGRD
jgi:hypothetical protein